MPFLVLGVQQFYRLLCTGQIHIKGQETILQKKKLGWVVSATIYPRITQPKQVVCCATFLRQNSIQPQMSLQNFGKLNKFPVLNICLRKKGTVKIILNFTRSEAIPISLLFNERKGDIGDSYEMALRRFHALENKFKKNSALKEKYSEFIQEYLRLGHMSAARDSNRRHHGFFLPHHAFIKEDNLTTKIRVVFDGSSKSSSGISLKDALMVGPTIYTRFRSFHFALSADIEKMYRQIEVTPEDSLYQRILWRENACEPIKIYNLKTVTYGKGSAPFLSTRVLSQLAKDESSSWFLLSL